MNKVQMFGMAALAVLAGCSDKSVKPETGLPEAPAAATAADANEMAVEVAGKTLTKGELQADVDKLIAAQGDKIPADQQEYARSMIQNQLVQTFLLENALVAKAKAENYVVTDAEIKAREDEIIAKAAARPDAPKTIDEFLEKFPLGRERALEQLKNGILVDKMLKDVVAKEPVDVKAQAEEIIKKITEENAKNAATDADAQKKIKELKAQLDATPADQQAAKFAELAKKESACPSSAKGGDLGTFAPGQMVKEFDEVAFKLPVGKISDPVKTQFGYHLIMVTEKNPAVEAKDDKPAAPETVRASHILIKVNEGEKVPTLDEVESYLKKQQEQKVVQAYILKVLKASGVKTGADFKQFEPPADEPETPTEAPAPAPASEPAPAPAPEAK